MGTFHDIKDPLHGITVVATVGRTVYVGRCHQRDALNTMLVGVDTHVENGNGQGEDGRSNQEFLTRAAKFGTWSTHEKMVLETPSIESLIPLNEFYLQPGEKAKATPSATVQKLEATPSTDSAIQLEPTPDNGSDPVHLTDEACDQVRHLLVDEGHEGKGLRLAVSGGGCSGLVYKVEFDAEADGDLVVSFDGFNVLLDRKSTIYLRGITLDYQKGLSGRGFQFQNPNASNTCGCGESFSV